MTKQLMIIIAFVLILSCSIAQDPIVNLSQGRIVGTKVYTEKSFTPIEVYYGIPYAIPPIGRYRFAAPERHPGWRRTFYAHRIPPRCPDFSNDQFDNNISEDCLFINIWTPRPADRKLLPVVIILYSESWVKVGIPLPCQDLAAEGVVVVTIAYRINLLGFFNLGTIFARGNLPLLDQYMGLLWVRDNIAAFGGDSSAITVLGHSAGADSLLYHISSPRTNGLFQRAVILSPRDIWKLIYDEEIPIANETQRLSREIAFFFGCSSKIDQEILRCMQSRSLADITSVYSKSNNWTYWTEMMQPVLENYLPVTEQYLSTSLSTFSSKKPTLNIDLLLGTVNLDALNYGDQNLNQHLNAMKLSNFIDSKVIPEILKKLSLYTPELYPILSRAIHWEFWNNRSESSENIEDLLEYRARIESSAQCCAAIALVSARLARRVSRLFVYRYYVPANFDLDGRRVNVTEAIHGSDLINLLGDALMVQVTRRPPTSDEQLYSSLFRRYIVQFLKYGKPDKEWQQYHIGNAQIYKIVKSEGTLRAIKNNKNREADFWLHYLPELSNQFQAFGETEKFITSEKDESRLRGGVFAMCGVAVVLLLMLLISALILQRHRSRRRFSVTDDSDNK